MELAGAGRWRAAGCPRRRGRKVPGWQASRMLSQNSSAGEQALPSLSRRPRARRRMRRRGGCDRVRRASGRSVWRPRSWPRRFGILQERRPCRRGERGGMQSRRSPRQLERIFGCSRRACHCRSQPGGLGKIYICLVGLGVQIFRRGVGRRRGARVDVAGCRKRACMLFRSECREPRPPST